MKILNINFIKRYNNIHFAKIQIVDFREMNAKLILNLIL